MKSVPFAAAALLLLAACVPAPIRPPSQPPAQYDTREAALAKEREARRLAELERARAERELAELKRRQVEARQPLSGKVSLSPSIAARPLDPAPAAIPVPAPVPEAIPAPVSTPRSAPQAAPEPARLDPAALAWQLSDDLRRLNTQVEVQTFYTEHGAWVLSLAAETLFEPGEASLRSEARGTLDRLARVLRHYATRVIVMEGPDAVRAQAVKRALTERGIPGDGIAANGTGERIEFVVPQAQALNAGAGR